MKDLKQHTRRISTPGAVRLEADPFAAEGTCPLCGRFMPLDARGYCGTTECAEPARAKIRKMAGGKDMVPNLYYNIGGTEIFNFSVLERWKEPVPPSEYSNPEEIQKGPDICSIGQCRSVARPDDFLCVSHRMEANAAIHKSRDKTNRKRYERVSIPKARKTGLTKKIRGLDKIKL